MNRLSHLQNALQSQFLYWYATLLTRTARMRIDGKEHYQAAMNSGRSVVYSFWHQQTMPFVAFGNRHFDPTQFVVIVVGDERGDTLGGLAKKLGAHLSARIDMQGNPMAAGRGVLNVIRQMEAGKYTMLAPDGPDGPAFEPKPGAVFLARKSGALIVPFGGWSRQAYQLRRWDRYLLPLPFARLQLVFGEPIDPDKVEDRKQIRQMLVEQLHTVRDRARLLAGDN